MYCNALDRASGVRLEVGRATKELYSRKDEKDMKVDRWEKTRIESRKSVFSSKSGCVRLMQARVYSCHCMPTRHWIEDGHALRFFFCVLFRIQNPTDGFQ